MGFPWLSDKWIDMDFLSVKQTVTTALKWQPPKHAVTSSTE